MKHMKNHFAGILSVILAVVSLSGTRMPVVSANSAENVTKKETIVKLDEKLGVEPGKVLQELKAHEKDGYYLGTPYSGSPLTAENCMRPNGAHGGNGAMNCTGFVAYVLEKCGADLSGIAKGSLRGGKVNASNWFHWMTDNAVESYHYNTIEELLAGGKAQKGDVIYFEPVSWAEPDADCHIGFFWGDHSSDNRFWHSASIPSSGNQISQLVAKSRSTVYLFKTTHNGSLELKKSSAEPETTADNQLYSIEGAEYTVYKSGTSEAVCVIRTDEKGYGKAEDLPEGTYDIKETKAPKGYVLDTKLHQITVNAGQTVTYECQDVPEKTKVEILIRKKDAETGKNQAQAGLSLEGAEFYVGFFGSFFGDQNEIGVKMPIRSWKLKSDADGVVRMDAEHLISGDPFFENNELPLGTVTVWETKAPEGYLVDTITHCIQTGKEENGVCKPLEIWNPVEIKEKIIRGDLKLVKAEDKTLKRLSDIPFQITSKATGESHVILTDKNGEASTGAYWNPHTVNTNEGKTSEDGIWFGEGTPDNTRGALPYGTYLVEELSCKNNEDRMLIPAFEVEVTKEMRVIDLGTLTNDEHPVPEIGTRASDRETGTHNGKRTDHVTVIDQVKWKNLEIGKEYVIRGILMDKATEEPVMQDGKEVTAEKKLVPDTGSGEIQMEFTFDATGLQGEQVVVFEEVYLEEKLVVAHADLEDERQSVTYKKEKTQKKEEPETPEKPKETAKAKTVATGDGAYGKILVFLAAVLLTGSLILRFLLTRMWGRKWKHR